jgi:cytochrome c oxidase subunit 2
VDNPLVVPVNKKVRMLLTAADVIHNWWVPDFGMKKDAIPGYINELWFRADKVGTYRGQCAELCGADHGFMPIVVRVVEQAEFDSWLASQKAARQAAAAPAAQTAAVTAAPAVAPTQTTNANETTTVLVANAE